MKQSILDRLVELSHRPGVDAVAWLEPTSVKPTLLIHLGSPLLPTEPSLGRIEAICQSLCDLARVLPEPTATVVLGKHNVKIHQGPDLIVLVFLESGHATGKSLARTLRRVVNGTPSRDPVPNEVGDHA